MLRSSLFRSLIVVGLVCFAFVQGGCIMQPSVAMKVTILGNQSYEVNFGGHGIVKTEDSNFRIEVAGLVIDGASKEGCYAGEIIQKGNLVPKTIMMEDITDAQPVRLIYDDKPIINPAHQWRQTSSYKDITDSRFKWLMMIDDSVRVFRFTITTTDGQTLEYKQATMYPGYSKEGIRKALGATY